MRIYKFIFMIKLLMRSNKSMNIYISTQSSKWIEADVLFMVSSSSYSVFTTSRISWFVLPWQQEKDLCRSRKDIIASWKVPVNTVVGPSCYLTLWWDSKHWLGIFTKTLCVLICFNLQILTAELGKESKFPYTLWKPSFPW